MHMMHLSSIDLNLLPVLHALLEQGSVRAAAKSVALSPSATSHALSRLRDALGDDLLVRAGRAMVLTPRAEAIRPALRRIMQEAEALTRREGSFDPGTMKAQFSVTTTDYGELVLLGRLSDHLARVAPFVDLFSTRLVGAIDEAMRSKEAHFALGVATRFPDDIESSRLFSERFVCVMRADHPSARARFNLKQYAALTHVMVAPRGGREGAIDTRLQQAGLERRVARTVGSFAVATEFVRRSDLVVTLPARVAELGGEGLIACAPPREISGFDVVLAWHRRFANDARHAWLKAQILEVAASAGAAGGSQPSAPIM